MGKLRVLILGDSSDLPAAAAYLQSAGDVDIVGLLGVSATGQVPGIPALGAIGDLPQVLATQSVDFVILAGSEPGNTAQILRDASRFGVPARILPSTGDLLSDRVRVTRALSQHEVDRCLDDRGIELSGPPHPSVIETFRHRTVLITGAGGSIGSELARQAADLRVSRLILLDHDENSLVECSGHLQDSGRPIEVVPVIGDIRNAEMVRHTFRRFAPHIVLHAAAYKQVPVLEENVCEGVSNNIVGTHILAQAALDSGADRFVFISTDKAVHPSSVMGATKRVAELVILQQAALAAPAVHNTRFACVRFVNVLGSRGSVVPIFLRQIAAGGPLTITHEEMTRYFMTIPQATQLVLQASTLDSSGNIYMLEMGDPVRIVEFAHELIRMSGLQPERDVEIQLIGMRPGEKLQERLRNHGEQLSATAFPYVFQMAASPVPPGFATRLATLESAARARQAGRVLELLAELPIDYAASPELSADAISS